MSTRLLSIFLMFVFTSNVSLPATPAAELIKIALTAGVDVGATAIFLAPIFIGWQTSQSIAESHRTCQKDAMFHKKNLYQSLCAVNQDDSDKPSHVYNSIVESSFALHQYKELSSHASQATTTMAIACGLASGAIIPTGCLASLYCQSPEVAAAAYVIGCLTAGVSVVQERRQTKKMHEIQDQIYSNHFDSRIYEIGQRHFDDVAIVVTDVLAKKKEIIQRPAYKNNPRLAEDAMHRMIRDVVSKK